MILKKELLCFFLCVGFMGYAQKSYLIKGNFSQVKNTELELVGFKVLKDTVLAKTQSDSLGNFSLWYPEKYTGAAMLKIKPNSTEKSNSIIVLLNKENFSVHWSDLNDFSTLGFDDSPENESLSQGMTLYQESEAILDGLKYLKPLYKKSPKEVKWLDSRIVTEENAVPNFAKKLPSGNYAGYYVTIRKLLGDMPNTASRYIERMAEHEKQFKAIDFNDPKLLHSGLLAPLLDGYYKLLESYGEPDKVAEHANTSTEALLKSLNSNPVVKQEVAAYLFKLLEKNSLFKAAEHLAILMLNDDSCKLDKKTSGLYEQYRKMAVGQQAPDITLTTSAKEINSLTAISSTYKLVVFGSSWCPKCQEEVQELKKLYQGLKDKYDLEIVFISLDTDQAQYQSFVKDLPWISSCDFKGWETQSAVDYFVFATPTLYLLDQENKIVLKPFGTLHVDAWLQSHGKIK